MREPLEKRLLKEADFWSGQPSGGDVEALCREAASVVSHVGNSAPSADMSAWVIEHGASPVSQPRYWAAGQVNPHQSSAWTENHMHAIRFARQLDAERVADRIMGRSQIQVRVCEHIWSTPTGSAS
jgi:hypothetical protein